MLKSLLAAVLGMLLGAGLGSLAAWLLHGDPQPEAAWPPYRTLAEATAPPSGPVLQQTLRTPPEFRYWLFFGVLLGGGFGLVAGAVVGAAAAVVKTIQHR